MDNPIYDDGARREHHVRDEQSPLLVVLLGLHEEFLRPRDDARRIVQFRQKCAHAVADAAAPPSNPVANPGS